MKVMLIGGPRDGNFAEVDSLRPGFAHSEYEPSKVPATDFLQHFHVTHTYQLEVIRAADPARDIYAYVHDSERRPLTRKVAERVEQIESDVISRPQPKTVNGTSIYGWPLIEVVKLAAAPKEEAFYRCNGMIFGFNMQKQEWVFIGDENDVFGGFLDEHSSIDSRRRASEIVSTNERLRASLNKAKVGDKGTAIAKAFQFLHRFLTNPEDLGPAMDRAEDDGLLHPNDRPGIQDEPADA